VPVGAGSEAGARPGDTLPLDPGREIGVMLGGEPYSGLSVAINRGYLRQERWGPWSPVKDCGL
jgi:hypothetical protein